MPPIVKDSETPKSPVAISAENGSLLQMPAMQRPVAEIGGRVQPVALEVPVLLNGSRTVDGSDKREPFSESTKTVLVFGNGAVIRLTSSVAAGQLLFLTNEKTKREVVCQVVKSKTYRNVSGYVELEFTEPAAGFWGVRFPSDRLAAAREVPPTPGASPISAPSAPNSETPTSDFSLDSFPFAPPTVAPSVTRTDKTLAIPAVKQQDAPKSLDELLAEFTVKPQVFQEPSAPEPKLENARLQEQLAEKVSNILQEAPVLPRESKTQNLPQPTAKTSSEAEPEEIEIPAWLMPKSNTTQLSNRPQESLVKVDLPASTEPSLAESLIEHSAPSGSSNDNEDSFVPTFGSGLTSGFTEDAQSTSGSKKGLWIGLAAAVLVLLAGGFWYLQQSGLLAGVLASSSPSTPAKAENVYRNNLDEAVPQPAPSSPVSDVNSNPVKAEISASVPSMVRPQQNTASPAAASNTAISTHDAQPLASQIKKPSLGQLHLAAPVVHAKASSQDGGVAAPIFSDSQDLPAAAAMGANFSAAVGQPAAPSAPLAIGGKVIPAKLLSSIQPSYTPMAKSQHVSGDVKIDALIDTDGRVTTMKIISGPTLLQESATEALRQWKYKPATLNGNAVSMHLTVTLQFRLQ